ncbi:hypothetical protein FNF29_08486 [Cafeteria roenbergensis]|uniref:Fatty acid desaturase domain-containing protein n=1 Tax=Cafeteria roenbergensis TaxID=33653 RepID=A0A5A8BXZ4_CAFRO|nr:hypothetical protein FNF29_08486 [Cafeteria roenbergensis]|eukprot:KAA0145553.1 hypothetical protein FNF29_08486 [Cafeteria roenbergensis]
MTPIQAIAYFLTAQMVCGLMLAVSFVEHHLFPTMPRHHLAKAAPIVEALCKKHGVRYHSQPLLVGVWEVLECLDVMAQPVIRALHEFPAM